MVDTVFRPVTLIRYELGTVPYSATGVFYESRDMLFLITNKHIFEHEHEISPDDIERYIRHQDNQNNIRRITKQVIDENNGPKWLTHPEYRDADIAALPLPDLDVDATGNSAYSGSDLIFPDE